MLEITSATHAHVTVNATSKDRIRWTKNAHEQHWMFEHECAEFWTN